MEIKKCILVISYLIPISWNVYSQDTVTVRLDKAIQLSYENSKQLKIARNDIQESEARLAQTRDQLYPSVNLGGAYLRTNTPDVRINFDLPSSSNGGQSGETPVVSQVAYATLNVSQPLFAGLRIRHAVASAGYLKRASELNAESQKEEVMLNTIAAFYNLYKLQSTRHLVEQSLKQATQRVQNLVSLEKNGVATHNDVLKAQLQESNLDLNLLDIRNNISVANFEMNILLGTPENTVLQIDTLQGFNNPQEIPLPALEYVQQAHELRTDLQALTSVEKSTEEDLKVARASYLPSLALTGGYVNAYIPHVITLLNALNGGIGLKYNLSGIFDTRHKVQQASARQSNATLTADLRWDEIKKEVFKTYANYQESLQKIETLKIANRLAEENFKTTQNSYDNNLALITDVLEAEVAELQSKVDQLYAKADASLNYFKLEKAAGLLNKDLTNQN
jgi:outer membrane protein